VLRAGGAGTFRGIVLPPEGDTDTGDTDTFVLSTVRVVAGRVAVRAVGQNGKTGFVG